MSKGGDRSRGVMHTGIDHSGPPTSHAQMFRRSWSRLRLPIPRSYIAKASSSSSAPAAPSAASASPHSAPVPGSPARPPAVVARSRSPCGRRTPPRPKPLPATPHRRDRAPQNCRAVFDMRLARPVSPQNSLVFRFRVETPLEHRRALRRRFDHDPTPPLSPLQATESPGPVRPPYRSSAFSSASPARRSRLSRRKATRFAVKETETADEHMPRIAGRCRVSAVGADNKTRFAFALRAVSRMRAVDQDI